jgi:DNA-binding transcriptional MocR family regulator
MSEFKFEAGGTKKQQVTEDLRRRIRTGDLPLGESIGDLFKLAEYYGCSWGTVRDAQRPLVEEGQGDRSARGRRDSRRTAEAPRTPARDRRDHQAARTGGVAADVLV